MASVDLNKLLTYKLDIDFAPLALHLSAQQAAFDALRASMGGGGGDVGPMLLRLEELEQRVASLPPPHLFKWDAERDRIEAASQAALDAAALAGSAAGAAGEARGEALGASSEASSAAADARKAAAAAAAAALAVPSGAPPPRPASPALPPPVNLDRIENRLEELERWRAASATDTSNALRVAREAKDAAAAAKEAAAAATAAAAAAVTAAGEAAAAAAARADGLEAALAELRKGLASATDSLSALLAAPPPPAPVAVPEGSSAEAAQLAALRGELGSVRAALAALAKKEGETATAGAATAVAVSELAARPPPKIPDIAPLEAAVAALGARADGLEAGTATLAGGLAKAETGIATLATRVGGAEQGLAGHSKELRELRGKLELLSSAHEQLAAEVKGLPRGGGGGGASEQLMAWASHLTQLTTVLSGHKEDDAASPAAPAAPPPATPAAAATAPDLHLETLGDRVKKALAVARPSASKFDVTSIQTSVSSLEGRVKTTEGTVTEHADHHDDHRATIAEKVLPRLPPDGFYDDTAARLAALEAKKADREEINALLEGHRTALASLHARFTELQKQVAALAAAVKPAEPANAAGTGKQLLRDLYCLSCARPADYQSTDRGPYVPVHTLTPREPYLRGGGGGAEGSPSEADLGGHYSGGYGGGGEGASPMASPGYTPVALGNLSATGAFQVLPNGMVLGKLGLRGASARGGPPGEPTALDSYVRSATTLSAAGAMTQCSPNRPGGMVTHRGPLPPSGGVTVRAGDPPPAPTARTASDQGLPAAVTHRGSGLVAAGVASASIVASPVVDPKTGLPVPHFYASEGKEE